MTTPEICVVSVNELNKNEIVWNKSESVIIDKYNIYKESGTTNDFYLIGQVNYTDYSTFVDNNSNPNINSNHYKISLIDDCDLETDKSLPHKTMHLTINKGMGNNWNLIWEPYDGFLVQTYNIYRGTTIDNLELLASVPASVKQYTDVSAPSGILYYQIEVICPNSCNPTKSSFAMIKI